MAATPIRHYLWRQAERSWRLPAQDDAVQPRHDVEGRADHRCVVTIKQRARNALA